MTWSRGESSQATELAPGVVLSVLFWSEVPTPQNDLWWMSCPATFVGVGDREKIKEVIR